MKVVKLKDRQGAKWIFWKQKFFFIAPWGLVHHEPRMAELFEPFYEQA